MACMCGDLCCPSCGPAQGNHRCSNCGAWTMDEVGCVDSEACAEALRLAADAESKWLEFYATHPDHDMDHDHSMDY